MLGGTFDPVHLGHIKISETVMAEMKLDKMIFIPSYVSPHKQDSKTARSSDRLNMLRLSIKDKADFEIDEHELTKQEISYSVDTIEYLKHKYQNDEIFWIIGADMLFYIEKWHEFKKVLKNIAFIAVGREGYDYRQMTKYISMLKKEYQARIFLCRINKIDISSSNIRNNIKNGRSVSEMLHPEVEKYIIINGLYIK